MSDKVPWSDTSTPCCCDECPTPSLNCQSRSASKSKCGFGNDGKYYLKKITNPQWQGINADSFPCGCGPWNNPACCSDGTESRSVTSNKPQIEEFDEDCNSLGITQNAEYTYHFVRTWGSAYQNPDPSWGTCYQLENPTQPDYCSSETQEGDGSGWWVDGDSEYENEFTTESLIAKVRAAFDNWTGTSCSSGRSLAEGEGSYSERQGRYKITLSVKVPDGQRLKIQLWTIFTPEDGSAATSTESWVTFEAGDEGSSDYVDIAVPESNGETSVVIGTYYCEDAS